VKNTRLLQWLDPSSLEPPHVEPDQWVRTTCGYCSVGCGMLVGVTRNQAVAVQGDPDHPVNRGRLCPKGLSEHHTLSASGRLVTPTVDGAPASWDRALDHMVDEITRLVREHGPESVAVLSTGQLVTEEFYALGKLVRLGFGLSHYDGNTTLCMASAVSGYKLSFGSDGPPGAYTDLDEADVIVLVGANIADNHPLLMPRVLGNRDATVITIDPRITKTAMTATLHLPLRPRTDIALLNGIIRLLIDRDLIDRQYVRDHTDGFEELARHVADDRYELQHVAATCGLDADDIERAALAIGHGQRVVFAWTMGVNHSTQGTETVAVINTLAAITGNIGRAGAAPLSITGQCNAMGTRETGFTASMPGYRRFDDASQRAELAQLWDIDERSLPTERGWAYPDIIEGIIKGRIKGLWVIGTNPVVSYPNRELLEWALNRLDLLVVQDGFETPTTRRANVTLPAAIWGEKEGTFTNSERRVSRVRALVDPPGDARSDFEIFLDIADRIHMRHSLFPGWKQPEDAFTEWRRVSAGRLCDYEQITYDRIDAEGGVQWPNGEARLYQDARFETETGRAQLHRTHARSMSDAPRDAFPLLLNTGRTVEHWHTRTKTAKVSILEHLAPEAWVEINPQDANRLGVRSGDMVRVASERGHVDPIRVRVTAIVRPGEVFIPFHYDEACANRLTLNEFDPISREPNYKQCAVRIVRSQGAASARRHR
jgi:anaerobic selenocysteine-containing dehydrogenase